MPKGDRDILKADCEDGFTRIANLLLEALALARLNGVQKGICLFLFRRTYGWNRSEDAVTLGEFAEACGSSRSYISRQLNDLINKNLIRRTAYEPGKTPVYSFVTQVAEWDPSCIDLDALINNASQGTYECDATFVQGFNECTTVPDVQGLQVCTIQGFNECTTPGLHECARVNQPLAHDEPQSEMSLKTKRKTRKETKIYSPDSTPYKLAELLLVKIFEHLPGYKKPDLNKWAWQMDALMRLDHRSPEEVEAVIRFAQADPFWKTNILSVEKLRKQYDQLNAKRRQRASPDKSYRESMISEAQERDEYEQFFK